MLPTDLHQALENWPKIIKKYKQPNTKAAVIQLLNTFLPCLLYTSDAADE